MDSSLDQYQWHDTELLSIKIDRRNAGNKDALEMSVRWPDNKENIILFEECRKIIMDLNFGMIAEESINDAYYDSEDDLFIEEKARWKKLDVTLEDLFCFKINTNSTNSNIIIIASKVTVQ